MISQSVKDWTENPVVTSIDTVEAPINDVPFPALSVCHPSPNFHQNWQVPELILNFIDINSNSEDEKVKKLVAGLSNFTDKVLDEYLALKSPYDVYDSMSHDDVNFVIWENGDQLWFHEVYCPLVHELYERLKKNPKLIDELKRKWKHSVSVLKPFNLDVLLQEFKVQKGHKIHNEDHELDCDVNDVEIWKFLDKLYFFNAQDIFENLGTTLRILSDFGELQVTPTTCPGPFGMSGTLCYVTCIFDDKLDVQMFHGIMKKVSKKLNSGVSVYDIPKLFNPQMPDILTSDSTDSPFPYVHRNFPTYTLCEQGIAIPVLGADEYETCRVIWKNVSSEFNGVSKSNNPYLSTDNNTQICGPGLGGSIG